MQKFAHLKDNIKHFENFKFDFQLNPPTVCPQGAKGITTKTSS